MEKQSGQTLEISAEDCVWQMKTENGWHKVQPELLSQGAASLDTGQDGMETQSLFHVVSSLFWNLLDWIHLLGTVPNTKMTDSGRPGSGLHHGGSFDVEIRPNFDGKPFWHRGKGGQACDSLRCQEASELQGDDVPNEGFGLCGRGTWRKATPKSLELLVGQAVPGDAVGC